MESIYVIQILLRQFRKIIPEERVTQALIGFIVEQLEAVRQETLETFHRLDDTIVEITRKLVQAEAYLESERRKTKIADGTHRWFIQIFIDGGKPVAVGCYTSSGGGGYVLNDIPLPFMIANRIATNLGKFLDLQHYGPIAAD